MARPSIKVISATDLRLNLSDIIAQIKKGQHHFVIKKSGKQVAVLVSLADYEQMTSGGEPNTSQK